MASPGVYCLLWSFISECRRATLLRRESSRLLPDWVTCSAPPAGAVVDCVRVARVEIFVNQAQGYSFQQNTLKLKYHCITELEWKRMSLIDLHGKLSWKATWSKLCVFCLEHLNGESSFFCTGDWCKDRIATYQVCCIQFPSVRLSSSF